MSISLGFDGIALAVLLVLPGLVTLVWEALIAGHRPQSGFEWLGHSVLRSIVLNAALLAFFGPVLFTDYGTYEAFRESLPNLPLDVVNVHLMELYVGAVLFGIGTGLLVLMLKRSRKELAYRLGFTRQTDFDSVFNATVLRLQDKLEHRSRHRIWLSLTIQGQQCIGQLRSANIKITRDKPIELVLNPVYVVRSSRGEGVSFTPLDLPLRTAGLKSTGVYVRLQPGDPLCIAHGPQHLFPEKAPTASD